MSEWDDDGRDDSRPGTRRAFAKTLHDFRLRLVQKAGDYYVEDERGDRVRYSNVAAHHSERDVDQRYQVLHDVFEQKMLWRQRLFVVAFDTAGDWELRMILKDGGVVVAHGCLEEEWSWTMGQDIPAFHVPDLDALIRRIQAQIRMRADYRHHLS